MEMVDSNNRWIYKGSVTTPPCARFVYWNVISTIYPVSKKHLDQFKAQLAPLEGGNLADYGNWREIMPEDDHGVAYISSSGSSASSSDSSGSSSGELSVVSTDEAVEKDEKKDGNAGLIVAVLILVIISLILLLATVYLYFNGEKKQENNIWFGDCRRYPPIRKTVLWGREESEFPVTMCSDWCGEFKLRDGIDFGDSFQIARAVVEQAIGEPL